jgi:hypothetical protein
MRPQKGMQNARMDNHRLDRGRPDMVGRDDVQLGPDSRLGSVINCDHRYRGECHRRLWRTCRLQCCGQPSPHLTSLAEQRTQGSACPAPPIRPRRSLPHQVSAHTSTIAPIDTVAVVSNGAFGAER